MVSTRQINEKAFDRCLANILDCISDEKLQELGVESLYEIFDETWLLNWFKHGCPIDKNSFYYDRQCIANKVFSNILEKKQFSIYLSEDDLKL